MHAHSLTAPACNRYG